MALSLTDVEKIAKLSRLSLTGEERQNPLSELERHFCHGRKMQSVNTDLVSSRWHTPRSRLRLREDTVTETDHAAEYQAVAPEVRNRLYIVPQVMKDRWNLSFRKTNNE